MQKRILYGSMLETNKDMPKNSNNHILSFNSSDYRYSSFYLDASMCSKHILMVGEIGSGKTNVFHKIMQDIRNLDKSSVAMIFDTKGDFYKYYNPLRDVLISTDSKYRNQTSYWNIFKEVKAYSSDKEQQHSFIRELSKSFFADRKNDSQPFFSNAAMQMFADILIALNDGMINVSQSITSIDSLLNSSSNELSNRTIYEFFRDHSDREIAEMLRKCKFKDIESTVGNGTSNQALGVFGELRSMFNDYFVDSFVKSDSHRDVSIIETIRKKNGVKIFIEYDLAKGEVLSPVYRMLFDLALKEALGRTKSEGNVFMIIDEFKLLPNLEHISDALNFGRSLGVKVFAGIQNIHQVIDGYGEAKGKSMLAGFMNMFIFHLLDYETRKYLIDNLGENYVEYSYRDDNDKNISIPKEGHTIEDHHILSLGLGEAIIKLDGYQPFKYKFNKFD